MIPYLPILFAALTGVIGALEPTINSYIVSHPSIAAALAGVLAILTALAKSPRQ